ncbi:MAG TPA: glycosyltransferase family 4 protein, partial [Anaerolinea sp.]|nr:glycosyltransferase family 4 protein [Anaerolinea sp.]
MRLLILSTEFPPGPGGIGTHAHQLALRLSQTGIELLVLTPQDYVYDKEIAAFNHAQPFRVRRLRHIPFSPFEAAYRINALDRAIRSFRPDWVMATGERSAWVAALGLKYRSIPWVAIGHGSEFGMGNRIERSATRWSFHAADAVVCVSRYTKTVMESKGIKPRATYVIHNGAD